MTSTPIQATIERVSSRFQYLNVSSGAVPDGWQLASDIVDDPEAVSWWVDQTMEMYGMADRQVAASFLVLGYFWYPVVAALGCYLLDARMPDLSARHVAPNPRAGVCFTSPRCLVLPDDPAAGHPDVSVVADRQAMRAQLMQQLEDEHATPLFATLRAVAPYGLPAMRANYLDRIASAILWLAEQLGDDDISRREVPAFMALAGPKVRTGIIELEHAGRCGVFLRRGGCCLNYRLDGRDKCDTCSLTPLPERIELLKAHLVPQ